MATKPKLKPFSKFEGSKADKDGPAHFKKFGKEGSPKENAVDKKEAKAAGFKTK